MIKRITSRDTAVKRGLWRTEENAKAAWRIGQGLREILDLCDLRTPVSDEKLERFVEDIATRMDYGDFHELEVFVRDEETGQVVINTIWSTEGEPMHKMPVPLKLAPTRVPEIRLVLRTAFPGGWQDYNNELNFPRKPRREPGGPQHCERKPGSLKQPESRVRADERPRRHRVELEIVRTGCRGYAFAEPVDDEPYSLGYDGDRPVFCHISQTAMEWFERGMIISAEMVRTRRGWQARRIELEEPARANA